jgi:hypothetical protein
MIKTVLVLLIFNSLVSFAQEDLFFPLKNEFSWSGIEKPNKVLKTRFIKNSPKEFEYYRQNDKNFPSLKDLDSCLHVFDINDDGLDDILFDGWYFETNIIQIFLNNGKTFNKVLSEFQGIVKMIIENNKVSKIYIQDWGCCCEINTINKVFSVNYNSDIPKFELLNQQKFLHVFELPDKYLDKPIKFSVLNNNYNIRFAPIIDDSTEIDECEQFIGNVIGKVQNSAEGYCLAQKTDSTGRIWWYVAFKPETKIKSVFKYYSKYEPKEYKLGWISSRFVKIIKE